MEGHVSSSRGLNWAAVLETEEEKKEKEKKKMMMMMMMMMKKKKEVAKRKCVNWAKLD